MGHGAPWMYQKLPAPGTTLGTRANLPGRRGGHITRQAKSRLEVMKSRLEVTLWLAAASRRPGRPELPALDAAASAGCLPT